MRVVIYYAYMSATSAFLLLIVELMGPMVGIRVANSLVFWILVATLPSGVLVGFVVSAAIAKKCRTSGTYRFKAHPVAHVVSVVLTVISTLNLLLLPPERGGAMMFASEYPLAGLVPTPFLEGTPF